MSWAGRRRFIIIATIAAVVIAVLAFILIPTVYQSPSCSDNSQNQGEQGIDCGGPCTYLCTALEQAPVVRFTKAVTPFSNRVDIIAYVDNPNVHVAAKSVPYTVTLYAADHTVLKSGKGTLDLLPSRSTPVFISNFFTGSIGGTQAFLTIDPSSVKWFTYTATVRLPTVASPTIGGTAAVPRVTTTLSNPDTTAFTDVSVIALVYDSAGNVLGASETLLPTISGQGSTVATFTWPGAFSGTPARIEVVPIATFSP